jgi:hypothetical protein
VERARRGEAAAGRELVHLHQEVVFRYAYLMLENSDDAEDVAQETFVRAFELSIGSTLHGRCGRGWCKSRGILLATGGGA